MNSPKALISGSEQPLDVDKSIENIDLGEAKLEKAENTETKEDVKNEISDNTDNLRDSSDPSLHGVTCLSLPPLPSNPVKSQTQTHVSSLHTEPQSVEQIRRDSLLGSLPPLEPVQSEAIAAAVMGANVDLGELLVLLSLCGNQMIRPCKSQMQTLLLITA